MLTPLDVENVKFRGALSGYDRTEVEQFRSRLIQSLEDYIAQVEQMRQRIAELEGQLLRYHESEELLKNSVVLAQRTADELIAAAHQRADLIVQAAQMEGESVRRSLGDLRSEREQFEYAFHGLLAGFLRRLEQGNPTLAAPAAAPGPSLAAPPPQVEHAPVTTSSVLAPAPREVHAAPLPAATSHPAPAVKTVPAAYRPTAAAPPANVRDEDAGSLMALLNAVQPEPEAAPLPLPGATAFPPGTAPAPPALEEPFALGAQGGAQDEPQRRDQAELREQVPE